MALRLTPKLITVHRTTDPPRLTLYRMKWNRYVVEKKYIVAVGAVGFETPEGSYFILAKIKNPPWTKPHSEWVQPPEERGKVVPYDDPGNPLRAWFLKLAGGDGVGIHGTANVESLGTAASHGCIRMSEEDVIDLAKRVGVGTPVMIW